MEQQAYESEVIERLTRIEALLESLVKSKTKPAYSTQEFGDIVGISKQSISYYCRDFRLHATKDSSGEWHISHEELERYQREGLLPIPGKKVRRFDEILKRHRNRERLGER